MGRSRHDTQDRGVSRVLCGAVPPSRFYCIGLFHRPGSLFSDFKTNLSTSYICGDYFTPLPPARTWAMHKNRGFYHLATFWVLGFLLKNISKALQILIQVVDFLQDKCTHRDRISHLFTVCTRSSSQPFPWIHLIHLRNLCTGIKGRNHRAWLFLSFLLSMLMIYYFSKKH